METYRTSETIESPVGPLVLATSSKGLTHLLFGHRCETSPLGDASGAGQALLEQTKAELQEYFAGSRSTFEIPLAPTGTAFQCEVWAALQTIPFGKAMSYRELAGRVGRPKAMRAVGAANGRNPISIIVPCHRVIGADGSLTGYGGGLPAKELLLKLEGWTPPRAQESSQLSLLN